MVRVFLGLKVVSHPTLAFTLGYKPKNCIKITTEQAKLTKCKFLNFSVNAGTQQLPARPGTYRICTELAPSSGRVKDNVVKTQFVEEDHTFLMISC